MVKGVGGVKPFSDPDKIKQKVDKTLIFIIFSLIHILIKKNFFLCSFPLMEKNTPVGAQAKRSTAD